MAISSTSGLPAVVSILQLGSGVLSSAAIVPASMTVGNVATTLGFPVSAIMTTGFGALPVGGATGQILDKASGTNFAAQWSNVTQFVNVGTGLATSGSATSIVASLNLTAGGGIAIAGSTAVQVALASAAGLSVLGVAGNATAVPAPIIGNVAGQVLQVNAAGTGLLWTALAVSGGQPPFNTTSLVQFGAVYGNGTGVVGATQAGTAGFQLTGNGSAVAPSFQLPIDVFVAFGDSNCVGQGSTTGSPVVPPGWVEQYAADGSISDANDPTKSAISTTRNASSGSLWPAFGIAYGRRVGLVLCGLGGSVQATTSDIGVGAWDPTGTLLGPALTAASAAMNAFKATSYAPTFKGFIYVLGSNDAGAIDNGSTTPAQYSASFASTIASCRAANIAGATYPDATFYVPIIGANLSLSDAGYAQVRGVQQAVASADGNIVVPWSEMYSFLNRGLLSSGVHPTQAGYNIFGTMVGKGTVPHIPDDRPYGMLNANTAIGQLQATGTIQHFIGANGTAAIVDIDAFGGGAQLLLRRADGTALNATSVVSGDLIGAVAAKGFAADFSGNNDALISFKATETHTSSGHGTRASISVTPNGATAGVEGFIVDQNSNVAIGAAQSSSIDAALKINANATTPQPIPSGQNGVHFTLADTLTGGFIADAFANAPNNLLRRANGTGGSPAALTTGDIIGIYGFGGWNGTAYANKVQIRSVSAEPWNGTSNGSFLSFFTTATGSVSISEKLRLQAGGGMSLGTTTDPGAGNFLNAGTHSLLSGTGLAAVGTAAILISSVPSFGIFVGTGAPSVAAGTGSLFLRNDATALSTRLYINTNGSTAWTPVTTVG